MSKIAERLRRKQVCAAAAAAAHLLILLRFSVTRMEGCGRMEGHVGRRGQEEDEVMVEEEEEGRGGQSVKRESWAGFVLLIIYYQSVLW